MQKRTDKTYQSIYGASKPISASAYIAELLIKRQADKSKVKLPDRFWSDPDYQTWTSKWLFQKRQAESMFRVGVEPEAFLRSLAKKECSWFMSLTNTKFQAIIFEENRRLTVEKTQVVVPIEVTSTMTKPKQQHSNSKIDKLR